MVILFDVVAIVTFVPAVKETGEYVPPFNDCKKNPDPLALGTEICTASTVPPNKSEIPMKKYRIFFNIFLYYTIF